MTDDLTARLLLIVDRAERGAMLAEEACTLRDGIRQLTQQASRQQPMDAPTEAAGGRHSASRAPEAPEGHRDATRPPEAAQSRATTDHDETPAEAGRADRRYWADRQWGES